MRMGFASVIAAGVAALIAAPASAGAVADFYKGRTITWVVGSGAGGTYGFYARTLAPYLTRYLPGNPNIVVQFNPKGGGRQAAAYVSNAALKDGSVISMTQQNVPVYYVLNRKGIKFDVSAWNWIGNLATIGSVLGVWHSAPAKTLNAMTATRLVVGATGRSSETFMNPTLANKFLGTKFKIVTGYRGSRPLFKAIESGEIDAFALSYNSFKVQRAAWIRDGKILFPMQTGLDSEPDLRGVPVMWALGKTELDRKAMKLAATAAKFGRTLWAPGGVPAARVAALRRAFDSAVKDAEFVATVKKRKLPLTPISGVEMAAVAKALFATEPAVVAHARKALGFGKKRGKRK